MRYTTLVLGLSIGSLAVITTLQERHAVAAGHVESYSTFPVLLLMMASALTVASARLLATQHSRHPRIAASSLAVCLAFCRSDLGTLGYVAAPSTPTARDEPTRSTDNAHRQHGAITSRLAEHRLAVTFGTDGASHGVPIKQGESPKNAPVALLTFNRPERTERALDVIRRYARKI